MDEALEVERFNVWKANLAVLGIPFMDVVRVMAGILLLGNVEFVEVNGLEVSVIGKEEMKSVSSLLPTLNIFMNLSIILLWNRSDPPFRRSSTCRSTWP